MHIITDIAEVKRFTKRGQRRTAIAELERRGVRYQVAHDGWPIILLSDVDELPSRDSRPNWEALK